MSKSSGLSQNSSGKRSRSKMGNNSEDESNANKKIKPDCCRVNDVNNLNKSRIYNFGYRKKPAELFRKDLISAMKMADTEQLTREEYFPITDSWREEWEKGVQVPVNPDNLPHPNVRILRESKTSDTNFKIPKKLIKHKNESEPIASKYELDLLDLCWLESISENDNTPQISDNQMEDVVNELEQQCARNIKAHRLGIEYDDHIICDVCRSPDAEEGNEMVFCDLCNICVHQACYGITEIPEGDWLCRPCKEFGSRKKTLCVLCPNLGGALKPTSTANQWAHLACALWVPEVSIGCVTTMEPITKIKQIPQTRWNLVCSLCNIKQGTPIQCSVKTCKIGYHVICAFNHKLKMKAIVESDKTKGVKLKSYCLKHTEKGDIDDDGKPLKTEIKQETDSPSKIQHEIEIATQTSDESNDNHENDFWKYIDITKVQQEISKLYQNDDQLPKNFNLIDFVVQYWKLKRTSNYGASLIKLTSSAQFEEQQQQHRNEVLRLRVDLERIRNLSYMINRREKVKRNWITAHQLAVEKAMIGFTGISNSETTSKHMTLTDETTKLVCDIVNNSVIYNYKEDGEKNRANSIIKTLKRLSKIEQLQKHKPNPYAKFYISHLKRKQENESSVSKTINGVSSVSNTPNNSLNGAFVKNKNEKPINGLSSPTHQMRYKSSPVNGVHNRPESPHPSSQRNSPEKKSPMNYRQSPRSLLKPKITSPSNVIKEENSVTAVPVLTRSNLSGYKIPKKKQEPSEALSFESEIDASIEKFKRRLNPELYTNIRSPPKSPTKLSFNQSIQVYDTSQDSYNYYNSQSQRGEYMTRGKDDKFFNRNNQRSLLRNISTRGQHGMDETALVAAAANDVDMRRHQSGFRNSIIN